MKVYHIEDSGITYKVVPEFLLKRDRFEVHNVCKHINDYSFFFDAAVLSSCHYSISMI